MPSIAKIGKLLSKVKLIPKYGKVKWYGPNMGKTAATKSNPNLVDFDDITRIAKQKMAEKRGLTKLLFISSKDPAYVKMLRKLIKHWQSKPLNKGKTLLVSNADLVNDSFDNVATLPSKSKFIEREVGRGGNSENAINWYDSIIRRKPDIKISDDYVSSLENGIKEMIPTKLIPKHGFGSILRSLKSLKKIKVPLSSRELNIGAVLKTLHKPTKKMPPTIYDMLFKKAKLAQRDRLNSNEWFSNALASGMSNPEIYRARKLMIDNIDNVMLNIVTPEQAVSAGHSGVNGWYNMGAKIITDPTTKKLIITTSPVITIVKDPEGQASRGFWTMIHELGHATHFGVNPKDIDSSFGKIFFKDKPEIAKIIRYNNSISPTLPKSKTGLSDKAYDYLITPTEKTVRGQVTQLMLKSFPGDVLVSETHKVQDSTNPTLLARIMNPAAYKNFINKVLGITIPVGTTAVIANLLNSDQLIPIGKSGIHIKKKNRGKFTASAKAHGMSVQLYAAHVLADPNSSPTQRKRANFARNSAKWHKNGGKIYLFKI